MTSGWSDLDLRQQRLAMGLFEGLDMIDRAREAAVRPRRVGFADLYVYASDPEAEMTPALADKLARDDTFQADLLRLLDRVAAYRFPRAAAASSGPVAQRDGDLYRIALRPSRAEPSQVYIVIELADLDAVPPELIYVCRPGLPCEKHRLPVAHDGAIQILADLRSPLVEALRDGHAEVFLR